MGHRLSRLGPLKCPRSVQADLAILRLTLDLQGSRQSDSNRRPGDTNNHVKRVGRGRAVQAQRSCVRPLNRSEPPAAMLDSLRVSNAFPSRCSVREWLSGEAVQLNITDAEKS